MLPPSDGSPPLFVLLGAYIQPLDIPSGSSCVRLMANLDRMSDAGVANGCQGCGGRGWKLRSVRRGLLVRTFEVVRVGLARVDCGRCLGSGSE